MLLKQKTLEKLREIINGDNTRNYRSGPRLVSFFNNLGFNDVYVQGFPSRWVYTDDKLSKINGTPELDKCIRLAFAVEDYIDEIDVLDALISEFNKYFAFDKWQVVRVNDEITFKKLDKIVVSSPKKDNSELQESEFLKVSYKLNLELLNLDVGISTIITQRLAEVEICINNNAPLSAIFLIGSILEGILLNVASTRPKLFNQASSAPKKDDGSVRKFYEWTLKSLIDVASEVGIIKADVKKFSQTVRDFRNYIHPYQQMNEQFSPDKHTALICYQVLKAAIYQIGQYLKENKNS